METKTMENNNIRVEQIEPNQFIIHTPNKVLFQSYSSIIAVLDDRDNVQPLTLGRDWDYSRTTLKYLYKFLDKYTHYNFEHSKQHIQKMIDSGDGVIHYDADLK